MDTFQNYADSVSAPATKWFAITPSDSTDLAITPKAIFIGGAGNISLTGADGVSVAFPVSAGQVLPLRAVRVRATNTTATGIVGLV
jgi:hypothetical protein